ncbi:CDP-glycerol glycerophosphotransferase family protein [Shewanella yunxiaonensis]|uniref:CDP-glycerol glycerophosphotransferase family protein n=1 Tax=Shewanella yunxiaonensis TaxID=2829809 RepID=A0ABX7YW35_9GAMM|nr:CDP-glycerol glycerophosphotransferase family protein [Shewanella yunxiaonensis]QUN06892.1 CDP-glycerol glycerophosphotransferase family protein [Shewanella yunxiaonensis]
MSFLIRKIIYLSTWIISFFIPRNKKKLILGAWFGQEYGDNTKYFLRYLLKNYKGCFDITWVCKSEAVLCKINEEFGGEVRVVLSGKPRAFYHQLRAAFFFTVTGRADVDYHLLGGATHIELWHGIPLKKINYDTYTSSGKRLRRIAEFLHKKKYFVVGPSKGLIKTYCSAFDIEEEKILNIGQCRTDVFFDNSLEFETLPDILKGKYILYMPTHRYEGNVIFKFDDLLDLEFIDSLCESLGCKFVIKKHFYHKENNPELNRFSNIVDITDMKIDPLILLKHSQALITDYSSCYIDYLLIGKPIIFYCYDLENYIENERGLYRQFEDAIPSEPVFNKYSLNLKLNTIFECEKSDKYISTCLFYHDKFPGINYYQSSSEKLVSLLFSGSIKK